MRKAKKVKTGFKSKTQELILSRFEDGEEVWWVNRGQKAARQLCRRETRQASEQEALLGHRASHGDKRAGSKDEKPACNRQAPESKPRTTRQNEEERCRIYKHTRIFLFFFFFFGCA